MGYHFAWSPVIARWPELVNGLLVDLWIAALGFALAACLGLLVAVLRISGVQVFSFPAFLYIQLMRGIPLYVFLLWIYFGIATVLGIDLTPTQATIITLAVLASGTTAETFRAGIEAVDRGHAEAAISLGLNHLETYRFIILPQAFRVVVPPLGNTFVALLKAATVVSVINVKDMVFYANEISYRYFTPFEAFATVALLLVATVFAFSILIIGLERFLRLP